MNRRVGKRPTMDYSNVNAFVHAMIQSWKPVYKQCDFVLDTTNGRTYDFIQRIEDELDASDVQFKARRQPNDTNDVDAKEASEDIQFNNHQSRKKEISEAVSKRAMSNKIRYDKRYKQKTSNQTNKKVRHIIYPNNVHHKGVMDMRRIAILTSGGDAPGMNAAIRALTRKAIHEGFEVFGIERGYLGIIEEKIFPLSNRDVGGIITQGGTMLKTARFPEFQNEEIQRKAYNILKAYDIDHLVVIGGDGSMRGATSLSKLGMSTMTIPCTIDNDMGGTQYTIGYDTALNTVVDAVGRIRDTSNSHERVAIVEVMGRKAGHIALKAGLACGAEIVLVPENPMPLHAVCRHLKGNTNSG